MKKLILTVGVLVVMTIVSCQKTSFDQQKDKGTFSFTATMEQPVGNETRSYLDEFQVKWNSGDEIKVFDINGKYAKMLTTDDGQTSAVFYDYFTEAGFDVQNMVCAVYPSDVECAYVPNADGDGKHGSLTFSSVLGSQTYVKNSFGKGANIAVARIDGTPATFKNTCGLLKLSLLGKGSMGKLILTTKGEESLWGNCSVSLSEDDIDPVLVVTNETPYNKSIILTIPDTDMCLLSTSVKTDFYVAVPSGCLGEGFDVEAYSASVANQKFNSDVTTTKDNTIERSVIKAMPVKSVGAIPKPDCVTLISYVENTSKDTHINLPYTVAKNTIITADFQILNVPNGGEYYVYGCHLLKAKGPAGRTGSYQNNWYNTATKWIGGEPSSLYERVQTRTSWNDYVGSAVLDDVSTCLFGSLDFDGAYFRQQPSPLCRIYNYTETVDDRPRLELRPCYNSETQKYGFYDEFSGGCLYPTSGPDLTGPALD